MPAILLASTSPHRRALLARLGLPFNCAAPAVAETVMPGESPELRATRLALAKARAVAGANPAAIVIGSDQVTSLATPEGMQLLHKPGDRSTCREQLRAMSGQTVRFDTAVAVIRFKNGALGVIQATTSVHPGYPKTIAVHGRFMIDSGGE
jgi:septum formation protein